MNQRLSQIILVIFCLLKIQYFQCLEYSSLSSHRATKEKLKKSSSKQSFSYFSLEEDEVRVLVKTRNNKSQQTLLQQSENVARDVVEIKTNNLIGMTIPKKLLSNLKNDPNIVRVENDYMVFSQMKQDDKQKDEHRKLVEQITWGVPAVLQDVNFWDNLDPSNTGPMKLCIADSGYDLGHVDLPVSYVIGEDGLNETWSIDISGHGTFMAGVAAALSPNNIGVRGIIPSDLNGKFELVITKALDSFGEGSSSEALKAVENCWINGAQVISMSWGCYDCFTQSANEFFDELYSRFGILLLAAAGNDAIPDVSGGGLLFPASYGSTISIGSIDESFQRAVDTNTNNQVELMSPGVLIESTEPNDLYSLGSGSSISVPFVASVATLLWMHFPTCTNNNLRNILDITALDIGEDGCEELNGFGVLQAKTAYDFIAQNGCSNVEGATQGVGGCAQLEPPCTSDSSCDDNDLCTTDICVLETGLCSNLIESCDLCGKKTATIQIQNDEFPGEITWEILLTSNQEEVASGNAGFSPLSLFTENICLDDGEYTFVIEDEAGDGNCCQFGEGFYNFIVEGITIASGNAFGFRDEIDFIVNDDVVQPAPTTSPNPCLFTPVTVEIFTDEFPIETDWSILNIDTNEIVGENKDNYSLSDFLFVETLCLDSGNYLFEITDVFGDGMCCDFGNGFYRLLVNDSIVGEGGNFGQFERTFFMI